MLEKSTIDKVILLVTDIIKSSTASEEKLLSVCKILKEEVYHYDWVGFYILNPETQILELSSYVGKYTDHNAIPVGKGVCGQVAENNETMIVQDVYSIENYISCSIDVQSEIVTPVQRDGQFIAEIDIDSHAKAPFTPADQLLLEQVCILVEPLF